MVQNFNILKDSPTLIYPNGGEVFVGGNIEIKWEEPKNIKSTEMVWYEIFITDSFDLDNRMEMLQIATLPYGNSSFSYSINKNLKGKKCRIGIRAVNHEGRRSPLMFSASNFSICNKMLPSPSVLSPIQGETYFSYIPILFDHDAIIGRCSQRSFYQIYYKCEDYDIDWTLLKGNIMVGSSPFDIDVSNFYTSENYQLKIELVDGDNVSLPTFIENIIINNINYFLIDTKPPKGSVSIVDNLEYINTRNIILKLSSYDETSAVKEFRIEQTNLGATEEEKVIGFYSNESSFATWDIQGNDGPKLIQARFKDYGDNIVIDAKEEIYFRTYKNIDNQKITALYVDGTDVYIAFAGSDDPSNGLPRLYKNQSLLFTLEDNVTALQVFNNILYMAVIDAENKGILKKMVGNTSEVIINNQNPYLDSAQTQINSLYSFDSVINSMVVFDGKIWMGMQNGELLSFQGSTITSRNSTYKNQKSISKLFTDKIFLYLFFDNFNDIMIMRKNENGLYLFNMVEME